MKKVTNEESDQEQAVIPEEEPIENSKCEEHAKWIQKTNSTAIQEA